MFCVCSARYARGKGKGKGESEDQRRARGGGIEVQDRSSMFMNSGYYIVLFLTVRTRRMDVDVALSSMALRYSPHALLLHEGD